MAGHEQGCLQYGQLNNVVNTIPPCVLFIFYHNAPIAVKYDPTGIPRDAFSEKLKKLLIPGISYGKIEM